MFERFGCYVDFGSTCSDTKTFHGRLYSTSEACSKGIISHFLKIPTMFLRNLRCIICFRIKKRFNQIYQIGAVLKLMGIIRLRD